MHDGIKEKCHCSTKRLLEVILLKSFNLGEAERERQLLYQKVTLVHQSRAIQLENVFLSVFVPFFQVYVFSTQDHLE